VSSAIRAHIRVPVNHSFGRAFDEVQERVKIAALPAVRCGFSPGEISSCYALDGSFASVFGVLTGDAANAFRRL
jgi:hypothetical protein